MLCLCHALLCYVVPCYTLVILLSALYTYYTLVIPSLALPWELYACQLMIEYGELPSQLSHMEYSSMNSSVCD